MHAKENRAKEKDPQLRYERFLKNAAKGSDSNGSGGIGVNSSRNKSNGLSSTRTSGSFGGKPRTIRGQQGKVRTGAFPAWMGAQSDTGGEAESNEKGPHEV
jgi:hypothetical protein